jgi:hypothetical protein
MRAFSQIARATCTKTGRDSMKKQTALIHFRCVCASCTAEHNRVTAEYNSDKDGTANQPTDTDAKDKTTVKEGNLPDTATSFYNLSFELFFWLVVFQCYICVKMWQNSEQKSSSVYRELF